MNAISNYHSLQASITKRMTRGLSLSFNYVWSHFLDDLDSSGWGSRGGRSRIRMLTVPRPTTATPTSMFAMPLKGFAVYQLPFGRGRQFPEQQPLPG